MSPRWLRRAPRFGALRAFCVGLGALVATALSPTALAARAGHSCAPDRVDERVVVSYVNDGDTLSLNNGAKLRLIGVNTPERRRRHGPPEPLALEARNRLQALLRQHGDRINLRFDAERRDQHGRVLAHAFLEDGRGLSTWLLEEGLGFTIAVPPNVWNLRCYQDAEDRARRSRRGVWGHDYFQPIPVDRLTPADGGFRRIRGRVIRVGTSRDGVWVNLTGRVALRIDRSDLHYFRGQPPARLENRTVTARGWLTVKGTHLTMRIWHPAALEAVQ